MKTKIKMCLKYNISWQPFSETEKLVDLLLDRCLQTITINEKVVALPYKNNAIIQNNHKILFNDPNVEEKFTLCHKVAVGLITLGKQATELLDLYKDDPFAAYILHQIMRFILEEALKNLWTAYKKTLASNEGMFIISPGENNIPLALQDVIFTLLQPIDITLDYQTKLMLPLKTISFIIGFANNMPIESFDDRCQRCRYEKCKIENTIAITIDDILYPAVHNEILLKLIQRSNILIESNCGGRGTCKKCGVLVKSDTGYQKVLACQIKCTHPLVIKTIKTLDTYTIVSSFYKPLPPMVDSTESGVGIVIDIGTTTIVICVYDKKTARLLHTFSEVNKQSRYGADVMHRISYTMENESGYLELQQTILRQIANMLGSLSKHHVNEIIVAGNPTMVSFIANKQIASLGVYPFTCDVIDTHIESGEIFEFSKTAKVIIPFAASAFIGNDVIFGILATKLCQKEKINILIDLGTNGEIVLTKNTQIYAISTAAGPAFEGGNISCGMAAISGAIYQCKMSENSFSYQTVNNVPPKGFCGSGIIDLTAMLLENKSIDVNGHIYDNQEQIEVAVGGHTFSLTQQDIREIQLAKSAVITGILILLDKANAHIDDIDAVYIAGGFGSNIQLQSLITIGLIPCRWKQKTTFVGNSALYGASLYLLMYEKRKKYESLKNKITTIHSFASRQFNDLFIENLSFEKKN